MHKFLLPILILSTFTLGACDGADESCPASSSLELVAPQGVDEPTVSFREQGPPMALYTYTVNEGPIGRAEMVKLVNACSGQNPELEDPALAVTLSWYKPDVSKDERVIGLGFSALAGSALFDCYESVMLKNGAQPF